jgi:hypothetical protein
MSGEEGFRVRFLLIATIVGAFLVAMAGTAAADPIGVGVAGCNRNFVAWYANEGGIGSPDIAAKADRNGDNIVCIQDTSVHPGAGDWGHTAWIDNNVKGTVEGITNEGDAVTVDTSTGDVIS